MNIIADTIARRRKELGLTQKELSEKLNVSPPVIHYPFLFPILWYTNGNCYTGGIRNDAHQSLPAGSLRPSAPTDPVAAQTAPDPGNRNRSSPDHGLYPGSAGRNGHPLSVPFFHFLQAVSFAVCCHCGSIYLHTHTACSSNRNSYNFI